MVKQISKFVILAVVFHVGFCQLLFATNLDYGFTIHGNEEIENFITKLNGSYGSNYLGEKICNRSRVQISLFRVTWYSL